jgi:hypothetical protein
MRTTALPYGLVRSRAGSRVVARACALAVLAAAALGAVHAASEPEHDTEGEGAAEAGARLDASIPAPILDAAEVHAGERVALRWPSLGGAAEEMELVFSIDDGRRYDVRVSPQLSGGECRYVWRVPNVGVHEARVRLRARIRGHERSGPPSAPFRVVPDPVRAPGRWVYRHGEWWEDAHGEPFEFPGLSTPPRGPSLRSGDEAPAVAVTVRAPEPARSPDAAAQAPRVLPASPAPAAPSQPRPRTFSPMRE